MRTVLTLRLLGEFEARDSTGQLIAIRRRKAQALLVFLALQGGRQQRRSSLASLLWGNTTESAARVSLRQTLMLLQRSLPSDATVLDTDRSHISLKHQLVSVDAVELECAGADVASDLYAGPLLPDFTIGEDTFDRWLGMERARIERTAVRSLREAICALNERGDHGGAEQIAHRLLEIDPALEDVHRDLIRVYLAAGRRDRALHQYRLCRKALRDELDVSPTGETEALIASALRAPLIAPTNSPAVRPMATTVAVRPLASRGTNCDVAELRDEIVSRLSRWSSFVVSDSSNASARYLVRGSVKEGRNGSRAAVRLVDGSSDQTLWAERFSVLQSDSGLKRLSARAAAAIASEIEVRSEQPEYGYDLSPPSRHLVKLAFRAKLSRTRKGGLAARAYYHQALDEEPDLGAALDGFAGVTLFLASQGHVGQRWQQARLSLDATERAVALEPRDASRRITRSCALLHAGDYDGALSESMHALDLNDANPFAYAHHGVALQCAGDHDRAVEFLGTAVAMAADNDPRIAPMKTWYARALTGAGCFQEAANVATEQLARYPEHGESYLALATSAAHLGDRSLAREVAARCHRNLPGFVAHRLAYQECRDDRDEYHLTFGFRLVE